MKKRDSKTRNNKNKKGGGSMSFFAPRSMDDFQKLFSPFDNRSSSKMKRLRGLLLFVCVQVLLLTGTPYTKTGVYACNSETWYCRYRGSFSIGGSHPSNNQYITLYRNENGSYQTQSYTRSTSYSYDSCVSNNGYDCNPSQGTWIRDGNTWISIGNNTKGLKTKSGLSVTYEATAEMMGQTRQYLWRVQADLRAGYQSDYREDITFFITVEDKCSNAQLSYSGTQPTLGTLSFGSNQNINFDNYMTHSISACPLTRTLEWLDQSTGQWTATDSNTWLSRSSGSSTVTLKALTASSSSTYKTNPMHQEQFRMRYVSDRSENLDKRELVVNVGKQYDWDCYDASTVRCLACPSSVSGITNSAYTSDKSYSITTTGSNSSWFSSNPTVSPNTATAECPVNYNLEYLNQADNVWTTVSNGNPGWVNGFQNGQASNAQFRINTTDLTLHGISVPMRFSYTIRSDPTLVEYDQFSVTFTNACYQSVVTKKATATDVLIAINQGGSWTHDWTNYWNDFTACPWESLFEAYDAPTNQWVSHFASTLPELSGYAASNEKNWTLNGLGAGTTDIAKKTNPALVLQYRFSFTSTISLEPTANKDTLYFSVTYPWDCFTASTVRCLACPNTNEELAATISGTQADFSQSIQVETGQALGKTTVSPTYTITQSATAECPRLITVEYLDKQVWKQMSASQKPVWATDFAQTNTYTRPTFKVSSTDITMQDTYGYLRYKFTVESDTTLVAYDEFSVLFTNPCTSQTVVTKATTGTMLSQTAENIITQATDKVFQLTSYFTRSGSANCPHSWFLEHYNTASGLWEQTSGSRWISGYNNANKQFTIKALQAETVVADTPYKTNPQHQESFRVTYTSDESLSPQKSATYYFGTTYHWLCFTTSTVRCLDCPSTIGALEQSITGDQTDQTQPILVEVGQSTTPLSISPTYTITQNTTPECPRLITLEYLDNNVWTTMSASTKPAWVATFVPNDAYTRPTFTVSTNDVNLQDTYGYLRYALYVESDVSLITYDTFSIGFGNPCQVQTVLNNAPTGSMLVSTGTNTIYEGDPISSIAFPLTTYFTRDGSATCPHHWYLDQLDADTQNWVRIKAANMWISSYNQSGKSFTLDALSDSSAPAAGDTPYKTNPPHQETFKVGYVSEESLSTQASAEIQFTLKYMWTCFTASTSRCLDCPNTNDELVASISGDQTDQTQTILVEAGQTTPALTINPTYTITNNNQNQCPRLITLEYQENQVWKQMSSTSKPAWVASFTQTNIYTRPVITVSTSDILLQDTRGYLRYKFTVESDTALMAFDEFSILFQNPCTLQTVILKPYNPASMLSQTAENIITQDADKVFQLTTYFDRTVGSANCPHSWFLEHFNTDTQTWEVTTGNRWISGYNNANKQFTVKALQAETVVADTPYKTNPKHQESFRVTYTSDESISPNRQATYQFGTTYHWLCFTASTVRCLDCPSTINALESSITGDQTDQTQQILVQTGQSTPALTINPTYTITQNTTPECPRKIKLEYLENNVWKQMSSTQKPAWVASFTQADGYTRPVITVSTNDILLQDTRGYLRYLFWLESDVTWEIKTYDTFSILFVNPCSVQTVVTNALTTSMLGSTTPNDISETVNKVFSLPTYFTRAGVATCPHSWFLEQFNTDTQTWEIITNNRWISGYNDANKQFTVDALQGPTDAADLPFKKNPPHQESFRVTYTSDESLSPQRSATYYFSTSYLWTCFPSSTVRCLACPAQLTINTQTSPITYNLYESAISVNYNSFSTVTPQNLQVDCYILTDLYYLRKSDNQWVPAATNSPTWLTRAGNTDRYTPGTFSISSQDLLLHEEVQYFRWFYRAESDVTLFIFDEFAVTLINGCATRALTPQTTAASVLDSIYDIVNPSTLLTKGPIVVNEALDAKCPRDRYYDYWTGTEWLPVVAGTPGYVTGIISDTIRIQTNDRQYEEVQTVFRLQMTERNSLSTQRTAKVEFTVTLKNPCKFNQLTKTSELQDQLYVLYQPTLNYAFPTYTATIPISSEPQCQIVFTCFQWNEVTLAWDPCTVAASTGPLKQFDTVNNKFVFEISQTHFDQFYGVLPFFEKKIRYKIVALEDDSLQPENTFSDEFVLTMQRHLNCEIDFLTQTHTDFTDIEVKIGDNLHQRTMTWTQDQCVTINGNTYCCPIVRVFEIYNQVTERWDDHSIHVDKIPFTFNAVSGQLTTEAAEGNNAILNKYSLQTSTDIVVRLRTYSLESLLDTGTVTDQWTVTVIDPCLKLQNTAGLNPKHSYGLTAGNRMLFTQWVGKNFELKMSTFTYLTSPRCTHTWELLYNDADRLPVATQDHQWSLGAGTYNVDLFMKWKTDFTGITWSDYFIVRETVTHTPTAALAHAIYTSETFMYFTITNPCLVSNGGALVVYNFQNDWEYWIKDGQQVKDTTAVNGVPWYDTVTQNYANANGNPSNNLCGTKTMEWLMADGTTLINNGDVNAITYTGTRITIHSNTLTHATNADVTYIIRVRFDKYYQLYPNESYNSRSFVINLRTCVVTSFTKVNPSNPFAYSVYTPVVYLPYTPFVENPQAGTVRTGTTCNHPHTYSIIWKTYWNTYITVPNFITLHTGQNRLEVRTDLVKDMELGHQYGLNYDWTIELRVTISANDQPTELVESISYILNVNNDCTQESLVRSQAASMIPTTYNLVLCTGGGCPTQTWYGSWANRVTTAGYVPNADLGCPFTYSYFMLDPVTGAEVPASSTLNSFITFTTHWSIVLNVPYTSQQPSRPTNEVRMVVQATNYLLDGQIHDLVVYRTSTQTTVDNSVTAKYPLRLTLQDECWLVTPTTPIVASQETEIELKDTFDVTITTDGTNNFATLDSRCSHYDWELTYDSNIAGLLPADRLLPNLHSITTFSHTSANIMNTLAIGITPINRDWVGTHRLKFQMWIFDTTQNKRFLTSEVYFNIKVTSICLTTAWQNLAFPLDGGKNIIKIASTVNNAPITINFGEPKSLYEIADGNGYDLCGPRSIDIVTPASIYGGNPLNQPVFDGYQLIDKISTWTLVANSNPKDYTATFTTNADNYFGLHEYIITWSMDDFASLNPVSTTQKFYLSIQIDPCVVTYIQPPADMFETYVVGSESRYIQFNVAMSPCIYSGVYSYELVSKDEKVFTGTQLALAIKDQAVPVIELFTDQESEVGTWEFKIKVQYANLALLDDPVFSWDTAVINSLNPPAGFLHQAEFKFTLYVFTGVVTELTQQGLQSNTAPYLMPSPNTQLVAEYGKSYQWSLGQVVDREGDKVTETMDVGQANDFLFWNPNSRTLNIYEGQTSPSKHSSVYSVLYTIKDDALEPKSQTYYFKVVLVEDRSPQFIQEALEGEVTQVYENRVYEVTSNNSDTLTTTTSSATSTTNILPATQIVVVDPTGTVISEQGTPTTPNTSTSTNQQQDLQEDFSGVTTNPNGQQVIDTRNQTPNTQQTSTTNSNASSDYEVKVQFTIKSVSNDGRIKLFFPGFKMPTKSQLEGTEVAIRQLQSVDPTPRTETYLTQQGYIDYQIRKGLDISIVDDESGETQNVDFKWEIVSIVGEDVEIRLIFDDPDSLSEGQTQSAVQVTVWAGDIFTDENGNQLPAGIVAKAPISRQVSQSDAFMAKMIGYTVGTTVLLSTLLSICVSSYHGIENTAFWGLYETVLLIAHLTLINMPMKGSQVILLQSISYVLRFEFFGLRQWTSEALITDAASNTPLNDAFFQAGYISQLSIVNLTPILIALVLIVPIQPLISMCFEKKDQQDDQNGRSRTKRMSALDRTHNFINRLLIESYLEISIGLFVNLKTISFGTSTIQDISLYATYTLLLTLCLMSVAILVMYILDARYKSTVNSVAAFDTFYAGMRTNPKTATSSYWLLFMARRLAFAAIVVFFSDMEGHYQLALLLGLSQLMLLTLIKNRPFMGMEPRRLQIGSEMAIFTCTLLTAVYSYAFKGISPHMSTVVQYFQLAIILALMIASVIVGVRSIMLKTWRDRQAIMDQIREKQVKKLEKKTHKELLASKKKAQLAMFEASALRKISEEQESSESVSSSQLSKQHVDLNALERLAGLSNSSQSQDFHSAQKSIHSDMILGDEIDRRVNGEMGYTEYMKNWQQHMGGFDESDSENGPSNQQNRQRASNNQFYDDQSMNAPSEQRTALYGLVEESASQIGNVPDVGMTNPGNQQEEYLNKKQQDSLVLSKVERARLNRLNRGR